MIDDYLMDEAFRLTGLKTKREVVELGLRTLLCLNKQARIRRVGGKLGKLGWQGDLEAIRSDK